MGKFFKTAWDFFKKAVLIFDVAVVIVYIILQIAFFGCMLFAPDKWPAAKSGSGEMIENSYY